MLARDSVSVHCRGHASSRNAVTLYFHTDKPQPMEAELPQSVNTESPQRAPALHLWENNHIHCPEQFLMETPSAKCLITDLSSQCSTGRKGKAENHVSLLSGLGGLDF